jgi:Glutamine amidotransferase class-I/HEAT repeats
LSLDAIETLLGEDFFAQAVECCINLDEGWGLAEGVLRILRPLGIKHCYNIYKTSKEPEERQSAVWLLKYTSNREVLEYIPEFLADPDERIQRTVVEILDQMRFWREIDDEDLISVLESAINHPNEEVRKLAIGVVSEETIQGIADFIESLEDDLWSELYHWKKRLKFETVHGFDLRCVPWYGQLQLSFLTDREDFDLSEAYVVRAPEPVHGKPAQVYHQGKGIFAGLPSPFQATRYHSLIVDWETSPDDREVIAWTEDNLIMGLQHRQYPWIQGVQFHPESVLTDVSHQKALFKNFFSLLDESEPITSGWEL